MNTLCKRLDEQEAEVLRALQAVSGSLDAQYNKVLLPPPGQFTAMANADRDDLERATGFYVR